MQVNSPGERVSTEARARLQGAVGPAKTESKDHDRTHPGAQIGLVGHGALGDGAAFVSDLRLPFPLLLDSDRTAYRSYALVQGNALQVLGPQVFLPWIRAEVSSETRQRGLKGGSFFQMPGTFVIDRGGVVRLNQGLVRLAHRSRHVADTRPTR